MTALDTYCAYIAVGSNLGDRLENCLGGIQAIADLPGTAVTGRSCFYQTSPVDYMEQAWFANGAVRIETPMDPFELLASLKAIEASLGRQKSDIRFGPRILDLDIVLYSDTILRTEKLTVPHPRMHKRGFVLQPLCDIDPTIIHPVLNRDVRFLLANLDDETQKVVPYTCSSDSY